MIHNSRNTDWSKFRSELEDRLNYWYYYNGFRMESKHNLEVVVMLDTFIRDPFASSCPEKIFQDKSMWRTNELNKLRKNTRRKLRLALRWSGPKHWESYCEVQCWYMWPVRLAKVNSWRNFCETTVNKVPKPTGLRKILLKNRGTVEEPLRLPAEDLTRTPVETLGILLESHLLSACINRGHEKDL